MVEHLQEWESGSLVLSFQDKEEIQDKYIMSDFPNLSIHSLLNHSLLNKS